MDNSLPYLTFPMLLPTSRNKKNWAQVLNLYSFIHPLIQQILSTFYVPDIFPGAGTTEMLLLSCSVVSDSCDQMGCSMLGLSFTVSQSMLKLMSIESVMPSNYLVLCHPLLLLSSIFPRIRVFSSDLALHIRWPKYWSFSP